MAKGFVAGFTWVRGETTIKKYSFENRQSRKKWEEKKEEN
jgi:hypothetical protein